MSMKFSKIQGTGNDFIIIDNRNKNINGSRYSEIARRLCTRRFSVGADGIMFIEMPTKGGEYKMAFYNSDGSIGEMCGNGARCIARYGFEKGISGSTQRIETTAGFVNAIRMSARYYKIRLNSITQRMEDIPVQINGENYNVDYVEMGNPGLPHVVLLVNDLSNWSEDKLRRAGRKIKNLEKFPKGANVNFCEVKNQHIIKAITYERGVEDLTLACGTGAGAIVSVIHNKSLVAASSVHVNMPGGELTVDLEINNSKEKIYLTGATTWVAEGDVLDEELTED